MELEQDVRSCSVHASKKQGINDFSFFSFFLFFYIRRHSSWKTQANRLQRQNPKQNFTNTSRTERSLRQSKSGAEVGGVERGQMPSSPPKIFSYLWKNLFWCLRCPPSTTYQGANSFQDDRNSRLIDLWFSFHHCFGRSVITRFKEIKGWRRGRLKTTQFLFLFFFPPKRTV